MKWYSGGPTRPEGLRRKSRSLDYDDVREEGIDAPRVACRPDRPRARHAPAGRLRRAGPRRYRPLRADHVASNRSQYDGPHYPIEIVYIATVNFNPPNPKGFVFNHHWERSDGGKSTLKVVRSGERQRSMVFHAELADRRARQSYDAPVRFLSASGRTRVERSSPVVRVICR